MELQDDDMRSNKRIRLSNGNDNEQVLMENKPTDKEALVGITEFVDKAQYGFSGILKKRYTDFLVNEIQLDGKVLHLQNLHPQPLEMQSKPDDSHQPNAASLPKSSNGILEAGVKHVESDSPNIVKPTQEMKTINPDPEAKSEITNAKISEDDKKKLAEYFNPEISDQLVSLYEQILENPQKKRRDFSIIQTNNISDRDLRTEIHQHIRRVFNGKIDSSTKNDGTMTLSALVQSIQGQRHDPGSNQPRRGKLTWIDRGGEYLFFSLYKQNKDTMEVISFLSRQLKVQPKHFQFAGTKDRRAVTVQRVSAYRLEAGKLAAANKTLRNAAIGDFEYQKNGLELGDLGGNEFVITLRECHFPSAENLTGEDRLNHIQTQTSQKLRTLHEQGFLNFYGLQRFGTFAQTTDVIGLKLLKGDFEGACGSILEFNSATLASAQDSDSNAMISQDDKARAEAINIWKTTNKANEALDKMPRKFSAETSLIRHLSRHPQDFLGALLTIQRNLRLMYVHAYQSLIWNYAASERWRSYGSEVIEGDLVLVKEHKEKESDQEISETVDADGEIIISASGDDRSNLVDDVFERARALTKEEALSGNYNVFDLVLPLPGFDVIYPNNTSGEYYKTAMAKDGLDLDNMRRKQKDFSRSGGYRKILARIGPDYDVQVHTYDNDDEQFVETDLDRINNHQQNENGQTDISIDLTEKKAEEEVVGGKKTAIVLKFQLGSSQYATMALRELSKGGIQAYNPEYGTGRGV